MLKITIPEMSLWDEANECFIDIKEQTLRLEHSLVSLAKWESKWKKSFLNTKEKTYEETIDYIKFMTLTQNVDPIVYKGITNDHITEINAYIEDPMTATTINKKSDGKGNDEILTAELIYYYMITANIPVEFQKWHLNRLITLIRVCGIKNSPQKKMTRQERLLQQRSLNAERRKRYNTRG